MHRSASGGFDRRVLLSTAIGTAVGTRALTPTRAARQEQAATTIAPVQVWDPERDTFSPYFPIGWYSFGPSARVEEIAASGANTVLYAGLGIHDWHLTDTLKQMDIANEVGVKVLLGLRGSIVGGVRMGHPDTYGIIPQYVKTFNRHPAMLGWQLGDELSADAAPRVNDTAALLRKLGSKHQTWQVHPHTWSHEDVQTLMARTDVCSYDGYTYLDGQPEFTDQAAARILAWQQAKYDLVSRQGWSGNVNVTQAVGCKCGDAPFRFPTYREYRWNVFSAIATAGARGTMNWIYCYWGGFYNEDPERFFTFRDQIVKPVNREQRMLAGAMTAGYNVGRLQSNLDEPTSITIPPATGPHRKFNKLGHILLRDAETKRYFLIISNNETKAHEVRLTLSHLPAPLRSLSIEEPRRTRRLRLRDEGGGRYALRDRLAGNEVAIYVLS